MKHLTACALILLCCVSLSGCWDYRGLDEIDIVTGIAVDKDKAGIYRLTIEIVDTQGSAKEGDLGAKYVEAQGETIFNAIRNSKKRLINKLYGGNMQTLVISRQIAETEGVSVILEEMLRDGEPRETMSVVISQEETAKDILLAEGIDSKIISYEIHDMVEEDNRVTAATVNMPLYKAYNAIKGTGNSLTLPAVHCVQNGEETVVESNGIAVFEGDKLIGFLPSKNSMYYLFFRNEVKGGVISLPISRPDDSVSLEIKGCKTNVDVSVQKGQAFITLSIDIKLNVMEIKSQLSISQASQRKDLEQQISAFLQTSIAGFFKDVQTQNKADIFGFGRQLYQRTPGQWASIEDDWNELFQNADIQIKVNAKIQSAGVLKDY